MGSTLHCTNYDEHLLAALPHLQCYPQLLPHIGNAWPILTVRILLVAESHYLQTPVNVKTKSSDKTWYNFPATKLTNWDKNCIDTRRVVRMADNYNVTDEPFKQSYQILYSLKKAVFDQLKIKNRRQTLFQHLGYYNYFQRPAEKAGDSIINKPIDDQVAYNTLQAICNIIEPSALIFVSQKAYRSFENKNVSENKKIFDNIKIQNVAHPASSWWNRKNSKLSANDESETGREKFMRTLEVYNFKLIDNHGESELQ